MPKLTKAQAARRCTEAKAKLALVFGAQLPPSTFPSPQAYSKFLDECMAAMKAIEKVRNRL